MRRKLIAPSLADILKDSPQGYRLRSELVPEWRLDRFEEVRLQERVRRSRRREWLLSRCTCAGAILGGMLGAWFGFRLYGPQGAVGGSLIGMVLGGVLSVVFLVLSLFALLGEAVYGVVWLLL